MALIKCKECKTEVSSKAVTCPKCGVRIASKPMGCGGIFALLFLAVIFVFMFSPNSTTTTSTPVTSFSSDQFNNASVVEKTLATATDKALNTGLPLLIAPFHRPFQYIGMSVADAAKSTGSTPNKVHNIIIDSEQSHMLLEAEGNFISFVEVELKKTSPCSQSVSFDPEPILGALSINPSELEFVRKKTHSHVYYDHKRKLQVIVSCQYDGAPLSVGFSSKYYGM
ncbi:MAG: hypothetical protein WAW61_04850 [Methylococcaceae bacterium]